MDAVFSWRRVRAVDLPECLRLHPAKNGAETVGAARALEAWYQLFEMTWATRSALIERQCNGTAEIVGFGFGAFVKKCFAEAEVQHPQPGLNARIIAHLVNGTSVIATYDEVRDANTRRDLQQVILDTSWKDSLSPAQRDEVRVLLGVAYLELYEGFRFSRILTELVDEVDLWHMRGQRSVDIDRFESYRRANLDTVWNPERALLAITAESMRNDPHSVAARLFHHHLDPQFAFTRGEQELLEAALDGADDASASTALFVSVSAIKHRWKSIFERVAAINPELCPPDGEGTRGIQKRQRILAYVRSHREELRPFDFRKGLLRTHT
jgi:hypothetical protein